MNGGVVADLCGFLFDAQGEVLEQPQGERIGVSLGQLDAAGTVLAICGGTRETRSPEGHVTVGARGHPGCRRWLGRRAGES